jgi:CarD family transcriptional regulator
MPKQKNIKVDKSQKSTTKKSKELSKKLLSNKKKDESKIKKQETKKSEIKKSDSKTAKKDFLNKKAEAKNLIDRKEHNLSQELNKVDSKKSEIVLKKTEQQKVVPSKKISEIRIKSNFKVGEYAVYPSHGVGKIVDIEKTKILGQEFLCYIMFFEKEKLNIKIPANNVEKIGLRHLASKAQMDEVFSILRSGIKKLKGMWSRRAQEYETKINSGDIILLAEVLRDLTRDIEDGDRSYSERIIYETAVNRLASEYSVVYGGDFEEAKAKVVATAKDKLGVEGKIVQKDEFDEFDYDDSEREEDDEDIDEDDEDMDEDDDMYDDEEDEKPRKRRASK